MYAAACEPGWFRTDEARAHGASPNGLDTASHFLHSPTWKLSARLGIPHPGGESM